MNAARRNSSHHRLVTEDRGGSLGGWRLAGPLWGKSVTIAVAHWCAVNHDEAGGVVVDVGSTRHTGTPSPWGGTCGVRTPRERRSKGCQGRTDESAIGQATNPPL